MDRRKESTVSRWGIIALAGVAALAIIAGGGGSASGAPNGLEKATVAQTAGTNGLPGANRARAEAESRANDAALLAGSDSQALHANGASNSGGDTPGAGTSPEATCPILPCFSDVPGGHTFYTFINRLYMEDLVTGYPCGGPGEPCDPENRPYYRPGAVVSRGQMAKFVDSARHLAGIDIDSGYVPISATSNQGDGAGVVGFATVDDGAGLAGYGQDAGTGRTISQLNSGVFADGLGTANSVGLIAVANEDNGAWVGSYDAPAGAYGLYVVHQMGGFAVGSTGDDPLNDSFIGGDIEVAGNCTGCALVTLMQNSGTTDLHLGEVAAMTAAVDAPSLLGDQPMVGADRAQGAYSTAVVGVVYYKWVPGNPAAPAGTRQNTGYYDRAATAIRPGEYFGVVTSGAYKEIKVSAANGPIRLGDLLVASDTPGVAMKADPKQATFGSVIGKAMGNLASGEGAIAVMITLK